MLNESREAAKLLKKHRCSGTNILCFDCRKPICKECMVVSPDSMRCRNCVPKAKYGNVLFNGSLLRVELVAVLGSFISAKFLSLLSGCSS